MILLKQTMKINTYDIMKYLNLSKSIGLLIGLVCLFVTPTVAQEDETLDTEVVNIVKPYTPTISDAFKIKDTPVLSDSSSAEKKEVKYTIFSVPVASTFTPAKGKAAKITKKKGVKIYDNYASLGFGNYTSILGELFTNFELSKTDNVGVFFTHNSSQGGIKDVVPEDKFYLTNLDVMFNSRQRDVSYGLGAEITHKLINWYGLPFVPSDNFNGKSLQQTYFGVNLNGNIHFKESVFEQASVALQFLGDAYSSSEIRFVTQPELDFPLSDFHFRLKGNVDYLTGKFDQDYYQTTQLKYGFMNLGVRPALEYADEDVSVSLGVWGYMSMDTQASNSDFFIYPSVLGSYRLVDELLTVYAGIEGDLQQNSYGGFVTDNPFVSPTLQVMPTSVLYQAFGGIKGKLTQQVAYNLRGGYGKEENKPFFIGNEVLLGDGVKDYQYGNSFQVVYDNVNTLHLFGELKVEPSSNLSMGVQMDVFSYTLDNLDKAYNLPDLKASVFADFSVTEKVFGGVSLFYVGKRNDYYLDYTIDLLEPIEIELDAYLDANLHVGYKHTDRLSFFLRGSNLLGKNYEKWKSFPMQGIQVMAGATYKFDW